MSKIHIIGSVGSGKTTFARKLSKRLNLPFYEIDNFVWDRSGKKDVRYPEEMRNHQFYEVIAKDEWIIEGAQHIWTGEGFKRADQILMLYPHLWVRNYRILRRFVRQKIGLEQLNYKQTFPHLMKLYKWNYQFENQTKDELLELFEPYKEKLVIIRNNWELNCYFYAKCKR
ncbi:shikimate kinase [Pseudalkalibacillus berkeleyi]|uniref:DNA topology modulation protein FlaR n=1 Tax=Pseudalkalibacillus berkeleyi TaxID=1069813 RepID=A0ABS9GYK7_9BACL|nr:shikimate kinase [Pseudalkalibacillus berkeleyi]MCF6136583.1 DNA topology modulation protein FlaR [Pseudalkalibacillus berkeleyi]